MRYQILRFKDHDFRVRFHFFWFFWKYLKQVNRIGEVNVAIYNNYDEANAAAKTWVKFCTKSPKTKPEILFDSNEIKSERSRMPRK